MGRRLAPDEANAWARVRASVRPLRPETVKPAATVVPPCDPRVATAVPIIPPLRPPPGATTPRVSANTLDRTWDRKLAGGTIAPDRTIDLHGHTLASAHAMLDHQLEQAVRSGERMILLVTGRPPRRESERPHARGAIRASINDWLRLSRHAGMIAAIRNAHPRHGGAGALYVVLRRRR